MFEWNMSVQKMLDCIEENLTSTFTLEMLANQLNYSPYYCTRQFHKYAGISLRDYIRLRKVSSAVIDLRDTGERILDIAVKYGFSSQEAFTRSFKKAYGMTPNEYRKMPKPLPLMARRNVFDPYYLGLGDTLMKKEAQEVTVSIQVILAHRFIGIRHTDAPGYWEFWKKEEEKYGYDRCSEIEVSLKAFLGVSTASVAAGFTKRVNRVTCMALMYRRIIPARYRKVWGPCLSGKRRMEYFTILHMIMPRWSGRLARLWTRP